MSVPHTYTIDWKHDSLTWLVDGVVVRTLLKSQSLSSLNPSGPKWFPETPSLIQFGVWDASYAADPRTVDWAGGFFTFFLLISYRTDPMGWKFSIHCNLFEL